MAINSYDIVSTLQALGMMKYWKGKHIILKKQVSFKYSIFPMQYTFCKKFEKKIFIFDKLLLTRNRW